MPRGEEVTGCCLHRLQFAESAAATPILSSARTLRSASSFESPRSRHHSSSVVDHSPASLSIPQEGRKEGMKRSSRQRPSSRGRVVWDEENLNELETSKTPKQKITEPKTPYYAPDGAGDGGLSPTPNDERMQMDSAAHAEAVRHALSEVTTEDGASSSRSSGSSWNFSEDELDYMERDDEGSHSDGNHSGSFEELRRKHYDNEFRKAKLLASQSELSAEDDEAAANGEAESESVALKRPQQQ